MTSINQHILERLLNAKKQLSNDAVRVIKAFIESQKAKSGGFYDRSKKTDPYYTVFGLTLCYVFNIKIDYDKEKEFLKQWLHNNTIDFVHATSILRCYYLLEILKLSQKSYTPIKAIGSLKLIQHIVSYQISKNIRKKHKELLLTVTQFEAKQGGFNQQAKNSGSPSVYANFLAYGLFEDLHFNKNWRKEISKSCLPLQLNNGAFVNNKKSNDGISSTTAAALLLMYQENIPHKKTANWLKQIITSSGGFLAGEQVPIADVLSTATSLLALNIVNKSESSINKKAVDFVNLHWDDSGGFFGSVADQIPDIEYTFYGLLAIGCN